MLLFALQVPPTKTWKTSTDSFPKIVYFFVGHSAPDVDISVLANRTSSSALFDQNPPIRAHLN